MELNIGNREREIQGLSGALDFFNTDQGLIITQKTNDIIIHNGHRIPVVPAWCWAGKNRIYDL
jgi:hypothetical protein